MLNPNHKTTKAYHDQDFLSNPIARPIRILSEYLHPLKVFKKEKIRNTIVFFGSARALSEGKLKRKYRNKKKEPCQEYKFLSKNYMDAAKLAYRITRWSLNLPAYSRKFYVSSGGGPGIMEAANRGSFLARGKSVGLNIALPYEQYPNKYITKELCFDFNYFFMRKYWFTYLAKALVVFPGGFGTLDELFEILTLVQTQKMGKSLPILLYNSKFWNDLINFDLLIRWNMIDVEDIKHICFVDSVEEAYNYLVRELTHLHL